MQGIKKFTHNGDGNAINHDEIRLDMNDTAGRGDQLDSSTNKLLAGTSAIKEDITIGEDITGVNATNNAVKSSATGPHAFEISKPGIEEEKKQ